MKRKMLSIVAGVAIVAGEGGRFVVVVSPEALTADAPLPRVHLELRDPSGELVERRAHRILYGLVHSAGAYASQYRPPLLEGRAGPGWTIHARAEGEGPLLLSRW